MAFKAAFTSFKSTADECLCGKENVPPLATAAVPLEAWWDESDEKVAVRRERYIPPKMIFASPLFKSHTTV